ncbi:hypothetical protein [Noviherbaspirillum sp. Root189]|uniref:hypothetical protein n=1 Tax=Noviherbaspirillum sp. Root189 TaxID=1736487 RepID=UPI00070B23B3|nr:hypothetical protein [Noviherbaspirillum sp. Root189]KRB74251.1 hypothetical protein ASE07_26765 [Noviherbaspirillum sp. Root189]
MQDLSQKLADAGFILVPTKTEKWIAVVDPRPEFRQQFHTDRIAKIQDNEFYVTVGVLGITARTLMTKYRLPVLELKSTSGRQKEADPGFDLTICPDEAFALFLAGLSSALNMHFKSQNQTV